MHLTRQTDHALRVLIYIAVTQRDRVTISEVAENFRISRNHLMKTVNQLAQLGYLETVRGKGGGIRLGKAPEQLVIGEVVAAIEPATPLIDCHEPPCPINGTCRLVGMMHQARRALFDVLNGFTLADVVKEPGTLRLAFPALADERVFASGGVTQGRGED